MENKLRFKSAGWAFLPIAAFVGIYLGAGLYFQAAGKALPFYQFPSMGAAFIGLIIAFLIGKEKTEEKFKAFAGEIGHSGVVTMLLIYMLAGAFSNIASEMGGREATVNFGMSIVPAQFLAAGIFVIAAFMGTATGTSIGTITAVVPIAVGIADKGGLSLAVVVGAAVGGAMFGDNLSMISDTTIAATSTQEVAMKDKFRVNLKIALPAAIVTIIMLLIFGRPDQAAQIGSLSFNFVKVLPYLFVFILAIAGVNVFVVLTSGIIIAAGIGIAYGDLTFVTSAQALYKGVVGMDEIFYLTLIVSGISGLIKYYGGIQWLLEIMSGKIRSAKSAQLVIAFLSMIVDAATATNTVAILVTGDLARNISDQYNIDRRRTASLLDIFSCVMQGLLPYSGQLLLSASFTAAAGHNISAIQFMPYVWYSFILGFFGILSIYVPFADTKKKNKTNLQLQD